MPRVAQVRGVELRIMQKISPRLLTANKTSLTPNAMVMPTLSYPPARKVSLMYAGAWATRSWGGHLRNIPFAFCKTASQSRTFCGHWGSKRHQTHKKNGEWGGKHQIIRRHLRSRRTWTSRRRWAFSFVHKIGLGDQKSSRRPACLIILKRGANATDISDMRERARTNRGRWRQTRLQRF